MLCTALCFAIGCCTIEVAALCCTVLCCAALCCAVLFCFVSFCVVLFCVAEGPWLGTAGAQYLQAPTPPVACVEQELASELQLNIKDVHTFIDQLNDAGGQLSARNRSVT